MLTRVLASLAVCIGVGGANAQSTSPVEMPIEDYLGLLRQIAPAAETGARTWLAAHATRCGRRLGSTELRRAISDDAGDPTLMAMIRAAQVQDKHALHRLSLGLPCHPRSRP